MTLDQAHLTYTDDARKPWRITRFIGIREFDGSPVIVLEHCTKHRNWWQCDRARAKGRSH